MEKEYKVTFVADYVQYEEWMNEGDDFWKEKVKNHPEQLAICKKYKGKTIKLSEIPAFVSEVGDCVISDDEIEVYNDYRE